jgi:2-methylcitrate dehydratase
MAELAERVVPTPEITPTRTAVERIAAFTHAARPDDLTPGIRRLYKRNILDSLGCAIAALPAAPFSALREQLAEYRSPGNCTLIAGGKTAPDQAAFFNTGLIRYVDMLDSYMAPGGLCHPSDNAGTVLAAAEYAQASGEQFMLALAISYEIQCRFTAAVSLMPKGFNHATQLAMSAAAACGKLFGLSAEQLAQAIAIATADNVSLACIHVEPVSQWKGFSPAMTGMRAVYSASLAKRGFTGPRGLFEGPKGLEQVLGQTIAVNWEDPSFEFITQTVLKKFESLIHGQSALEAVLDLRRSYSLSPADVEHVRCDIFEAAWDFAGGGSYGSKDHPWTKEQGDYNIKYLIAAALLDGQVGPPQLDTARVRATDAQAMVARIEMFSDPKLTARFPKELAARVTVRTKDGRVLVKEHLGYQGGIDNPLTWEQVVEKFHWLSEASADEQLRGKLIDAVDKLDSQPVSHLMGLLAQVRPMPTYARTHRGIQ